MPTYDFLNSITGEKFEIRMKIKEMEEYKKDNPHMIQQVSDVKIGDPVALGKKKIDRGFKEVLKGIGERTPGGQGLSDYAKDL